MRSTFEPKLSRIFSTLTHGCRFENTYDISARSAVLFVRFSPSPLHRRRSARAFRTRSRRREACHALLETLIDFNESERESGVCLEDELFLQTTDYGQIHHLIELWKLFVSVGSFLALQLSGSPSKTIRTPSIRTLRRSPSANPTFSAAFACSSEPRSCFSSSAAW